MSISHVLSIFQGLPALVRPPASVKPVFAVIIGGLAYRFGNPLDILIGALEKAEPENLALALAKSLGAVLVIYLWGRRVIRPLFLFFARHHQPDLFMALILLSTLGIASLALPETLESDFQLCAFVLNTVGIS